MSAREAVLVVADAQGRLSQVKSWSAERAAPTDDENQATVNALAGVDPRAGDDGAPAAYTAIEARALALAKDPEALAQLRARLLAQRDTAPLFDTDRFRRDLESAYQTMWQRHQQGLPPAPFAVPASPSGH